ncbi:MAG: sulfur transferase domain-containing protein [Cyanobacteria bacterium P01_D01_bin.36]
MNAQNAVIKPVTDSTSIAGQISDVQISRLSELGFQAVLNVRSPQEDGTIPHEQAQIEALGIPYINLPVRPPQLNKALIDQAIEQIDTLPKPLLVHCGSALRAAFVVMMYRIVHEGISLEEAKAQAIQLGFDFDQKPPLKAAINNYFAA